MKKNIFILLLLIVFASSCEYEASVESNSTGVTDTETDDAQKEKRTDIKFNASSEKLVEAGEVFQLTYSVNEQGSFYPPKFENFDVLAGPFTSSSSSTQIINGKRSSKVSISYIYNISAQKTGTFIIPPAEISVGGHTYKSNSLEIKVIGEESPNENNAGNKNKISSNKDIFLITEYSNTNVYKGEYIVATTKLYSRKNINNVSTTGIPDYNGFWTEVLEAPHRLKTQNELLHGKKYISVLLNQTLLFSQKPGNFTISPYEIELQLKKKDGKARDFFGNIVDNYKLINKRLKTKKQTITVKPLPQPIPDNFSGTTGKNIEITSEIDLQTIKTDESANLKISISGNGNLHLLNDLKLELPDGLEHFKPQIEKTEKFTESGAYGERSFSYIIVGSKTGDYKIKPFEFVYFDSEKKDYITVKGEEISLTVGKGLGYIPPDSDTKNVVSKDIRHIKSDDLSLNKKHTFFAGSVLYYLIFVILFALFILFLVIRKKYIAANSDIVKVKKKNASKVSQKRLKTAHKYMTENNNQAFYKEILTSIWGYLSDKMSVSADSLTNESIEQILKEKNVSDDILTKLLNVIEICGYAQYGPAGEEGKPENIYKETATVINELESYL